MRGNMSRISADSTLEETKNGQLGKMHIWTSVDIDTSDEIESRDFPNLKLQTDTISTIAPKKNALITYLLRAVDIDVAKSTIV